MYFTPSRLLVSAALLLSVLGASFARAESFAQDRLRLTLSDLEKPLASSTDPALVLAQMEAVDTRFTLFMLESLFRLLGPRYGDAYKAERTSFKEFEDVFGKYADSVDFIDFAKKQTPPADPAKIAELEQKRDSKKGEVVTYLQDKSWIPNASQPATAIAAIQTLIDATPWKSAEKDKSYLLKAVAEQLRKTQDAPYDLHDLEGGIHEWRRQVRWFMMYTKALEGMFVLGPDTQACPIADYAALITAPIAKKKYSVLPASPLEPKPCVLTKCLYLAAVQLNSDIGEIKDKGQGAVALGGQVSPEAFTQATKLYDQMIQNNLLKRVADEIDACNI